MRLHLSSLSSRILLIGTGTYTSSNVPDIPAVDATLQDLAGALVDRCGVQPSQIRIVLDPNSPAELGDAVLDVASDACEVLVIYYVGHGFVHSNGELYLATRSSDRRPGRAVYTAASYAAVRESIYECIATAKIVILDCCFSGRAINTLDAMEHVDLAGIHGAYVLTAASRDDLALAPPSERYTAFSGQLLTLLREGDPNEGPELTLGSVYRHLARTLPQRNCARPQRRTTGELDDLVLAPNPAYDAMRYTVLSSPVIGIPGGENLGLTSVTSASYTIDGLSISLAILQLQGLHRRTRGSFARWLKKPGQHIDVNETLAEIAIEGTLKKVHCPISGILLKQFVGEGDEFSGGERLAVIGVDEEPSHKRLAKTLLFELESANDVQREELIRISDLGDSLEHGILQEPTVSAGAVSAQTSFSYVVRMPALGYDVTEGTAVRWLKEVGDSVDVDEALVEISTDKVDTEMLSPVRGVVTQHIIRADETATVGDSICAIEIPGFSVVMPVLWPDVTLATVSRWRKSVGSWLERDETIVEVSAAKRSGEVRAPTQGILAQVTATKGKTIRVGAELCIIISTERRKRASDVPIVMPALGESISEGTVVRWLKSIGDSVVVDEPVVEISTDKVSVELRSPAYGVLNRMTVEEGQAVEVGHEIGRIATVTSW